MGMETWVDRMQCFFLEHKKDGFGYIMYRWRDEK